MKTRILIIIAILWMTIIGKVSAQPPSGNGDIETNGIEISPLQIQIGSIAEIHTNIYANDLAGGYCWPVGSILVIVSLPDEGIEFESWKSPINGGGVGPYFTWTYDAGTKTITGVNHTAMCDGNQEIPYFNVRGKATVANTYLTCSQIVLNIMNNPGGPIWGYNDPANDNGITGFVIQPKDEGSTVSCWNDAVEPNWSNYFTSACATPLVSYTDVGTCEGTRTYTFTFANCSAWCAPNSSFEWTYTYTIEREDFTIPATTNSSTVSCASAATSNAVTLPVVTSNCGETLTPGMPVENKAGTDTYAGCEGTKSYTWTYTDCEGNSHDWTYTYTIEREDFTIPATTNSGTVPCASAATSNAVILPVVTSNCGETLTPGMPVENKAGTDTYAGCEGTKSYTWTYTDCEGNSHDWTYTYTIEREDFTIPATTNSGTVPCASAATSNAVILPVVTSNCGETLTPGMPVENKAGTDTYAGCEGTKSYTWTYTDCEGNSHDWTYTYTIEREDFTIPATTNSGTVPCASAATSDAVILPMVTSNCGETLTPGMPVENKAGTDTYAGCEGTKSYTWTYTDCEGNSHDWTYTYTIEREDFTIPATTNSGTVPCASAATSNAVILPMVTSNCGETLTPGMPVENKAGTDTYAGCEGTKSYTWTYTDCKGNSHDWTYTYTIDIPDFTAAADGDSTVNCASNALVAPQTPPVTDACGRSITPVLKTQPTAIACEGTMVWVYTYEDCAGSSHDWTYTYTISLPALVLPANDESTVTCSDLALPPTPPSISDACGRSITPVEGTAPTAVCNGDMVWEFTYKDCANRESVWKYTYHVNDNVKPVITLTGNATEYVCFGDTYMDAGATASDNCSGNLTSSIVIVNPVNTSVAGTYTVTYNVTDNCSNAAVEVTRTVIVRTQLGGTISGTITIPQNGQNPGVITFTGSNGTGSYTFAYTVQHDSGPINSYTVSGNPTVTVIQPNNVLGVFTYTLISVTDANGCTRTFDDPKPTAIVTVVQACDLQPSIVRPTNLNFTYNEPAREGVVRFYNWGPGATVGQLTFRISKVSNFTMSIPGVSATYAGLYCTNGDFDIIDDVTSYRIVAKSPLTSIPANSYIQIGYSIAPFGYVGSNGKMTVSISNGIGGDSNNTNNRAVAEFGIN